MQCPAETAQYLSKEQIRCQFRDVIFVRGKGNMRTYFVDLTDDLYVASTTDEEQSVPDDATSFTTDDFQSKITKIPSKDFFNMSLVVRM